MLCNYYFSVQICNTMIDGPKHEGMRHRLVEQLRQKGIEDPATLSAMATVPRHLFLDSGFLDHAYEDKAFPIEAGQTISQPYTVAFQTALLNCNSGNKVLEIGTGSGYQTAVLCQMGMEVYSVERQQTLFKKTALFLPKLNYHPKKLIFGDGYKGFVEAAPYHGIIVTAGAPEVPKALLAQLSIGGRLVIPVGVDQQIMTLYTRTGIKNFDKKTYGEFRFVPLLTDKASTAT